MKKIRIEGRLIIEFEAEGLTKEAAMDGLDRIWDKIRWAGTVIPRPGHPGRARIGNIRLQNHPRQTEIEVEPQTFTEREAERQGPGKAPEPCKFCNGRGWIPVDWITVNDTGDHIPCSVCRGTGKESKPEDEPERIQPEEEIGPPTFPEAIGPKKAGAGSGRTKP